jgi:hypothetical protein
MFHFGWAVIIVSLLDSVSVYVDGDEYGTIEPPLSGFKEIAQSQQPAASVWTKGTILAPFDEFVKIS